MDNETMDNEFEEYKALMEALAGRDIKQRQEAGIKIENRLNEAHEISKKILAFNERQTIALEKIAKALERRR